MNILGIETSCDETAVAIVDEQRTIHANLVLSQLEEHRVFGGVVPEVAARAHMDQLDRLIEAALDDAGMEFSDLDGVAATSGPGLIGGVMVGMMAGKAVAAAHKLPFVAANHLEAHVLTSRLSAGSVFPYLVLLVSGGHTQILVAEDLDEYHLLGQTIDDACGECFDKAAKLMGLPYPGGPNLERAAHKCADIAAAEERFPLPRPLKGRDNCDFSFSGLKTAVRTHVDNLPKGPIHIDEIAMLSASFQEAVADVLIDRCARAIDIFKEKYTGKNKIKSGKSEFVVCGGVAANKRIRRALRDLADDRDLSFHAPPGVLCSDNAAMIAWTGVERIKAGLTDSFEAKPRPRWPIEKTA